MPSGRYLNRIDELYPFLGRLVVEWSSLELCLCQMMRAMLGISAFHANAIFYSAVNNQTRFELIQKCITVHLSDKDDIFDPKREASSLISRARKLNKTRNHYIHCWYVVNTENQTVYKGDMGNIRVDETDSNLTISGSRVGWADIQTHCDAVDALGDDIYAFTYGKLCLEMP